MLTLCATDGLDFLNEEYVEKLTKWSKHCCIAHAVARIDATNLAPELKLTLVTLKHVLCRISPNATDFICQLMQ